MAVVTFNIWTGGPLLALWIGSRVQGSGPPSMLAVGLAAISLGVISYVMVRLLAAHRRRVRPHDRSRLEREPSRAVAAQHARRAAPPAESRAELSPLEVILIACVVLVVALFEVWFFFYSASPIDQHSGRGHDAPLIGLLQSAQPRHENFLAQRMSGPAAAP